MVLQTGTVHTAVTKSQVLKIVETRCLDCHDNDDPQGEVDLSQLLKVTKDGDSDDVKKLWTRMEGVIAAKEMSPPKKNHQRTLNGIVW